MVRGDRLARPKKDSQFLARLRYDVDGLSGVDRHLVDPLLVEADALRDFVEQLRKMVEAEGPMVEKEVGGANNRHIELVENPALTAYSKNVGRFGDLLKKISTFAKAANAPEEVDEFDAFNAR